MTDLTAIANPDEKISCAICHAKVHAIQLHLRDHHPDVTVEQQQDKRGADGFSGAQRGQHEDGRDEEPASLRCVRAWQEV